MKEKNLFLFPHPGVKQVSCLLKSGLKKLLKREGNCKELIFYFVANHEINLQRFTLLLTSKKTPE